MLTAEWLPPQYRKHSFRRTDLGYAWRAFSTALNNACALFIDS